MNMTWSEDGLPPVCGDRPRVLILGSYPGVRSCRAREYYAHRNNRFWPLIEVLFGIEPELPYQERTMHLVEHGIALWDVISSCERSGSDDASIRRVQYNDIRAVLAIQPTILLVAFNGGTAYKWYRTHYALLPSDYPLHRLLPSTSPANTRYSLGDLARHWLIVKEFADLGV